MNKADGTVQISAIVPVGKRHSDTAALYADYKVGLDKTGVPYEMIFVLDGRRPEAATALRLLQSKGENLTVIGLSRDFGEATALMVGFERAVGSVIVTLPAYYQIEGSEIPKLVTALASADIAVGRREPRAGGRLEALRRAGFHKVVAKVTGLQLRDLGCGAQAMKRKVLEEISLYGDLHRFLAVLADRQGFRVTEIDVRQSAKDRFEGHYRVREYAHRALDIITVLFLVRFTKKPLRFFGMIGVSTFGLGALLLLYLVIDRAFFGQPLADRPALLLASLLAVVGLQLFAIGLIGELIIFTHARDIKDYQVDEVIQYPRTPDSEQSPAIHPQVNSR
jgi:glycosyltransferase involved in cell wall biosynthesis